MITTFAYISLCANHNERCALLLISHRLVETEIYQHFNKPTTFILRAEDEGRRILQNVGQYQSSYTVSHPKW